MSAGSDSPPRRDNLPAYREALRTPWWWYVIALLVAGILAAEFRVAGLDATVWIPFAVMLPLSALLVWSLGRGSVEVRDGQLRIRGAHLSLANATGAVALDARTLRLVVGREGDPAAFVSIRPWIGPGVQVWLDDTHTADDGVRTPYWVVSSRRPDELVAVLRAHLPH